MEAPPSVNERRAPTEYSSVSPFWIMLSSEVMEMNNKLSMLKASLTELIRGVQSGFVEEPHVYTALAENSVPFLWKVRYDIKCIS